ncbi:MAG: hypothetical protein GWP19_13800 [Planctomycetia bacterium]|nr:hypothetical protein [Planctomycetia bacterium]
MVNNVGIVIIAGIPTNGRTEKYGNIILKALPDMFNYLDNINIPKTTNGVEGYFGRMKQKYRQHPGISKQRQKAFFNWYLYLCKR